MLKVLKMYTDEVHAAAIYIGRPSSWGNPFPLAKGASDEERHAVVVQFEEHIRKYPAFIAQIKRKLKGKDLVCYCAPKECHGDVLLRIANEE